eukprot:CAMPEP_0185843808 /NCGR_PEP_ID=MMETSP1354-20130828/203_1 /TAXON_ID=708628 /ORGANISM="Erythrolobus madagascarensis, Strain CCMP3276" /LENGTH=274 /DNA_ID=CAMNT_0028543367 /DNA_START=40 /DNA_END=864 /DNA_ORIENTATION=-
MSSYLATSLLQSMVTLGKNMSDIMPKEAHEDGRAERARNAKVDSSVGVKDTGRCIVDHLSEVSEEGPSPLRNSAAGSQQEDASPRSVRSEKETESGLQESKHDHEDEYLIAGGTLNDLIEEPEQSGAVNRGETLAPLPITESSITVESKPSTADVVMLSKCPLKESGPLSSEMNSNTDLGHTKTEQCVGMSKSQQDEGMGSCTVPCGANAKASEKTKNRAGRGFLGAVIILGAALASVAVLLNNAHSEQPEEETEHNDEQPTHPVVTTLRLFRF